LLLKKWLILLIVLSCTVFAVSSGCSESGEKETTDATQEGEESSSDIAEEEEVEVKSTGNSDNWCPVGSSWNTANPQTGEKVTMNVVGTETVDGVLMCKAVYETNSEEEDFSKVEYLWSEDGNTLFWTAYDESGEKISEFSMKDGNMKIIDKDGQVTEYTQSS
jgi:hypothetical protein